MTMPSSPDPIEHEALVGFRRVFQSDLDFFTTREMERDEAALEERAKFPEWKETVLPQLIAGVGDIFSGKGLDETGRPMWKSANHNPDGEFLPRFSWQGMFDATLHHHKSYPPLSEVGVLRGAIIRKQHERHDEHLPLLQLAYFYEYYHEREGANYPAIHDFYPRTIAFLGSNGTFYKEVFGKYPGEVNYLPMTDDDLQARLLGKNQDEVYAGQIPGATVYRAIDFVLRRMGSALQGPSV